jgi:hypothetical protein
MTKPPPSIDPVNVHTTREAWLRAATDELRPLFAAAGYTVPEKIRAAIGFTSTGRKSKRRGECWSFASSADQTFELFVRVDIDEPTAVLAVLTKELVHATLPASAGHGALFKAAALKLGLQGPMRNATPGVLLEAKLAQIADVLGPLPHARLDIGQLPLTAIALDRPRKQKARMLKAECQGGGVGCGYVVRIASKWVRDLGAPLCPKHGAMIVDDPKPEQDEALEGALEESV